MNYFQCIGIGKVTALKQTNTKEITVYLSSKLPFGDGEITTDVEHKQQVTKTAKGDEHTSNVLESTNVPAEWINIGQPNRLTPPDVNVGSTVAVYQIGGQDKLRWTTWGVDTTNMALETVLFGYSANGKRDINKPFNYNDYYVFEISPRTGKVSLRTSQANGEQAGYELSLDTKLGRLLFADTLHNVFGMDSVGHHIFMTNEEQSLFQIERENITATCKDTLTLEATKNIGIKANKVTIDCQEFNMTAPKWQITGEGTIDGGLHVTKGLQVDGQATGKDGAPFYVNDFKTTTTASYNLHVHNETGSVTGGPRNA